MCHYPVLPFSDNYTKCYMTALMTNLADPAQTVQSGWIVMALTVFVRVVTCPDNDTITAVPCTVHIAGRCNTTLETTPAFQSPHQQEQLLQIIFKCQCIHDTLCLPTSLGRAERTFNFVGAKVFKLGQTAVETRCTAH